MKSYEQMLKEYRRRKKDTVVDSVAAGLTCADDLAAATGLLAGTDSLMESAEGICGALPFVVIAASEGAKVVKHAKPASTGVRDGALRMVKSGVAMGVGAAAATVSAWAAIPAAMGARSLMDCCKLRVLTGLRVQGRIRRLQELNAHIRGEEITERIGDMPVTPSDAVTFD